MGLPILKYLAYRHFLLNLFFLFVPPSQKKSAQEDGTLRCTPHIFAILLTRQIDFQLLDSMSTFQWFHMQPATITLHDLRQIEDRELFIS